MRYWKAIFIAILCLGPWKQVLADIEIIDPSKPTSVPTIAQETNILECPEGSVKLKGVCIKPPQCANSKEENNNYRCLKFIRLNTCDGQTKAINRDAYTPDSRDIKNWCLKGKSMFPLITAENKVICGCDASLEEKVPTQKVKEISLNEEDRMLNLSLQVASIGQQMFGSLDVLFLDLYHSENSQLLFTIEELTGEQKVHFSENLLTPKFDEKIIQPQGINLSFQIKKEIEPKFLGMFICKDSKAEKRCLHKKIESINQSLINYDIKTFLPANYTAEDKTYFFSFVILDNTTLYPLTAPFDGNKLLSFAQLLNFDIKQTRDFRKALLQTKEFHQTLNPEPMQFSVSADFKITPRIILPRLDSSKGL